MKVEDKVFNNFISKNSKRNNHEYFIFFKVLPEVINFLYYIHNNKTGPLCFLARDAYFLKLMYDKLFPGEETYYVFSSRRAFYNSSPDYLNYMKIFYNKGANWIDINGSNRSFYNFFKKNFNNCPKKFIFLFDAPFLNSEYTENVDMYSHSFSNDLGYLQQYIGREKFWYIEKYFRAIHRSTIDVEYINNKFMPIYEEPEILFEEKNTFLKYINNLRDDYPKLQNIFRPNMFMFSEHNLIKPNYRKLTSHSYNGVAAIDLDGTTDCPNKIKEVADTIKFIKSKNFKVVIITARFDPLEINLDELGLSEGVDIYYNTQQIDIPEVKAKQLEHAHLLAGLSLNEKKKSLLIDNEMRNINSVKNKGFSYLLATCGTFSNLVHNYFKDFKSVLIPVTNNHKKPVGKPTKKPVSKPTKKLVSKPAKKQSKQNVVTNKFNSKERKEEINKLIETIYNRDAYTCDEVVVTSSENQYNKKLIFGSNISNALKEFNKKPVI